MTRKILLILALLLASTHIFAQEYAEEPYTPRSSYGILAGGNFNLHGADFNKFEGVPSCCPGYESGTGFGLNFGLFYSFPIDNEIDLSIRGRYIQLGSQLSRIEEELVDDGSGNGIEGSFEHRFDASISSIALEPLLEFKLSDQFRVRGGFRLGFIMDAYLNEHVEELVTPSNGVFIDEDGNRTRKRNSFEGEIPNASSIEAAILAGISYDMPLNESYTLFLVPQVDFAFGLTSYVPDFGWTSNTIVGGIGLRYAPRAVVPPKEVVPPPPPPPPPPLPPPPPPPSVPLLDASIQAVSVNENGEESDVGSMKVEEFLLNRTHPLLNYIFFGENSAEIPKRYKRISENEKEDFSFKQFFDLKTMDVYYEILNILGRRMEFYPQARIELVGCNTDTGLEKDNTELSRNRAQAVKDYLVNKWDIKPDRIEVKARDLPETPSNLKEPDGIEENRRVEINANIDQVFEPIIIRDTLRTSNPPYIRFKPTINTDIGVNRWKIVTLQEGRELRVFTGSGELPDQVDWDLELEREQEHVPRLDKPLNYKLIVSDKDNKTWESPVQKLPVEQHTIEYKTMNLLPDKEFDVYSMIGFGFGKAELNDRNIFIADKAKERLRDKSEVSITGYSDRIGSKDYNQKLSQRRAYNVAEYLDLLPEDVARGLGEQKLLYDNNYPEGRFYSRTVLTNIVTPIE